LVTGYDLATDDLLLEGFHEWLLVKLGCRCEFYWGCLIPCIAFPDNLNLFEEWTKNKPSIEQENIAITTLFNELEEFYLVKKDRNKGLRWIYAQYDELCKRLDDAADAEQDVEGEVIIPCNVNNRFLQKREAVQPISLASKKAALNPDSGEKPAIEPIDNQIQKE